MNILDELQWRGLLADCTDAPELAKRVSPGPITLYCGFDPTADSLHVGNLVPLLALRRFQLLGHHPIAAGGRRHRLHRRSQRQDAGAPAAHQGSPRRQHRQGEGAAPPPARFRHAQPTPPACWTTPTWTAPVSYLDFLRDIGKHFSVNQMVAKESVRARMEDREAGISYTEFSYMLLQAFDFYVLCRDYNCELQIGGSDQWGNITAGIDLIRKKLGPHGLWPDPAAHHQRRRHQVRQDRSRRRVARPGQDQRLSSSTSSGFAPTTATSIRYLKFFTFLSQDEIAALEKQHAENPGARAAHKALAKAVTDLVHGPSATAEAMRASEILFGGDLAGISEATFNEIVGEVPTKELGKAELDGAGMPLVELLVHGGLCPSKGQARKDIEGGGVYVNNVREASFQRAVTANDLLFGKHLLLRKGKRNYVVLTAK